MSDSWPQLALALGSVTMPRQPTQSRLILRVEGFPGPRLHIRVHPGPTGGGTPVNPHVDRARAAAAARPLPYRYRQSPAGQHWASRAGSGRRRTPPGRPDSRAWRLVAPLGQARSRRC